MQMIEDRVLEGLKTSTEVLTIIGNPASKNGNSTKHNMERSTPPHISEYHITLIQNKNKNKNKKK